MASSRGDTSAILIDSSTLSQPLRSHGPPDCSTESADQLYGGSQYVCRYQPRPQNASFTPNLILTVEGTDLKIYGQPSRNLTMRYRAGRSGDILDVPLVSLEVVPKHQTSVLLASLELQAQTIAPTPVYLEFELSSGFAIDYVTYQPFDSTQFSHLGGKNMIVDDWDASLSYSEGWTEVDMKVANLNPYSNSLSMTTRINASVSFAFWGSSLTIMGATIPQAPGNLTVRCEVDDITFPLFEYSNSNSTTPAPSSNELQLNKMLFNIDLRPRKHNATITLVERTGSQALYLDSLVFKTVPESFKGATARSDGSDRPGFSSTNFDGLLELMIIAPVVFGCLLLCILGCLWRKRRTRRRKKAAKDNSEEIKLSSYSRPENSQRVAEPEDRHLIGVQQAVDAGPADAPPAYNEANHIR